ncbi:SDR family oxidoreductase [Spirillospora sp. NPDC048911]|uniref:SDR family oxidoreductase n=1 Tax=Spirillospora sp. NPDC048911 TaxID=3364527 RepID=UPI00371507DC
MSGSPGDAWPDGLLRFPVRLTPMVPSGLAMAGLWRRPLAVTDDGHGVAPALVELLNARGVAALVTGRVPADADGVVILDGLREVTGPHDAIQVNRQAFLAARAVAERLSKEGGIFVTVQDTGGDFGLEGRQGDRAWLGGLVALARTAAHEWPHASVKAIDCEQAGRGPAQVAAAIADELFHGGTLLEVALRTDGRRMTLLTDPVPPPADGTVEVPHRLVLAPGSVVVATGGARGITAAAVRALARAHRPRLVLIGRTPFVEEPPHLRDTDDATALRKAITAEAEHRAGQLPLPAAVNAEVAQVLAGREIRRTLKDLSDLGCQARYLPVDVRDADALGLALDLVRAEWGPVTGIIHGAGVLADKLIVSKSSEAFDRVFDVKVRGLWSLLTATADDPLEFVNLFSSTSAQFGNAGQSDYAMANEVLAQVAAAEAARVPDRNVVSVGWGPWEGGMISPTVAALFRQRGITLIPADQGVRAFLATLTKDPHNRRLVIAASDDRDVLKTGRVRSAELEVGLASHPQLEDHRMGDVPIVPLSLMIDWFVAAAGDWAPGRETIALSDVRVVHRIEVRPGSPRSLSVVSRHDGQTVKLELVADEDASCCRASLEDGSDSTAVDWTSLPQPRPPVHADPYESPALFHGPAFRALRSVERVSNQGAVGVVAGVRSLDWAGPHPHTDPLAVDAGFQLALLWAELVLGTPTLPMGAGGVRVHRTGPVDGESRCVVRARGVGAEHATCDIVLLDSDGRPRMELLGVSLVQRPKSAT